MTTSQNGWPVLQYGSRKLHKWVIPARTGTIEITLRNGSAGFLLAHFLLWWAEAIEPLAGKTMDDWGFAPRAIRGSTVISNHSSATAADANAQAHPLGVRGTLSAGEKARIFARLRLYRGCLRHGAFYNGRVDEMHVEINKPLTACETRARVLMRTPRGKRLLKANPDQRAVILS